MYVIETELGRFEADTERAAKKLLKAATAAAAIAEATAEKLREAARIAAESQAYHFYDRFLVEKDCPRAWRSYRAGGYGYKMARMLDAADGSGRQLVVSTIDGAAKMGTWSTVQLTAVIIDGSGWATAVELQDGSEPPKLWAIGTAGDCLQLARLGGLPFDWFHWGKTADDSEAAAIAAEQQRAAG